MQDCPPAECPVHFCLPFEAPRKLSQGLLKPANTANTANTANQTNQTNQTNEKSVVILHHAIPHSPSPVA